MKALTDLEPRTELKELLREDDGSRQQRDRYLDRLVEKYTDFASMEDLVNAKGTYRPSLYLRSGERWIRYEVNLIADEYNRRQETCGDTRRAFRLAANGNSLLCGL
jgi:hypothetical protein